MVSIPEFFDTHSGSRTITNQMRQVVLYTSSTRTHLHKLFLKSIEKSICDFLEHSRTSKEFPEHV